MTYLPPNHKRALKHAGHVFLIRGLEGLTRDLIKGGGFEDVDGLQELQRRAQALADAIDARLKEVKE